MDPVDIPSLHEPFGKATLKFFKELLGGPGLSDDEAIKPVVSIVIPNKNRAGLVREALESLRAQTLQEWEAIVVDDGSTDESVVGVEALARVDPRVRSYRRQGTPGGNTCRNEGMDHSRGDWVIFLDSDDMLSPDCLEGRLRKVVARPGLEMGVFPHDYFRVTPGDMGMSFWIPKADDYIVHFLTNEPPWQTAGPMWRRDTLKRLDPWCPGLASGQDLDFHVRALLKDVRFEIFDAPRFLWRQAAPNASVSQSVVTPKTVEDRELFMRRTCELLDALRQWTAMRRLMMARLHWVYAEWWMARGEASRAERLWALALERRLFGRWRHAQGKACLRLKGNRGLDILGKAWRRLVWPVGMQHRLGPDLWQDRIRKTVPTPSAD